jgi:hypothetical protein
MESDKAGYIYVLHNPSLRDDYLKIGRTSKNPYVRARKLSSTSGVAQEYVVVYWRYVMNSKSVENAIKHYLKAQRVNRRREVFALPLEEAVRVVRRICDDEARIEKWSGRHLLPRGEFVRWSCSADDLLLFTRFPSIFHPQPTIVDIWGARDDGDEILVTTDPDQDPGALAPETWTAEDWVLRPGDRITWVSQSRDDVLAEAPPRIAHLEISVPTRVIGLSVRPRTTSDGFPILFSAPSPRTSMPLARAGFDAVLRLGLPRSWAPADDDLIAWRSPGWHTVDSLEKT